MKDYEITDANGNTYVAQFDDEEAKRRGLTAPSKKAPTPANKARTTKNKSA